MIIFNFGHGTIILIQEIFLYLYAFNEITHLILHHTFISSSSLATSPRSIFFKYSDRIEVTVTWFTTFHFGSASQK